MKDFIKIVTNWKTVLGIQGIATIALLIALKVLDVLPIWLFIIVAVLLIAILVGVAFLMKPVKGRGRKKAKTKNKLGKLLSLVLSIVMAIGTIYITKTQGFLNDLQSVGEISRVSVMVMADSEYDEVTDIKGQTIYADTTTSKDMMDEAVAALEKEVSVTIKSTVDYSKMANALYSGDVKAIFVDEACYAMLEADHENFESETKVIWTYEYVNPESESTTKSVDVTKDSFVIYLSGIDTKGKVATRSRSDVNMLVTVNPTTHTILMSSIPRDYYVKLAKENAYDKLTHSGLQGTSNTVKTVENLLGIDINYYVRVNFTSVEKIVDALGGITVTIPKDFTSGVDGTKFKKGTQTLNGSQALKFCRERYALGGDTGRVKNQQKVLKAMINKAISPAILTKYTSVLKACDGYFETDLTADDITSLIKAQISSGKGWTIENAVFSGKGTTKTGGYYIPNKKLYYMMPDSDSVSENVLKIKKVKAGESLSE